MRYRPYHLACEPDRAVTALRTQVRPANQATFRVKVEIPLWTQPVLVNVTDFLVALNVRFSASASSKVNQVSTRCNHRREDSFRLLPEPTFSLFRHATFGRFNSTFRRLYGRRIFSVSLLKFDLSTGVYGPFSSILAPESHGYVFHTTAAAIPEYGGFDST